jgi:predicted O-methyltransferase YrrM
MTDGPTPRHESAGDVAADLVADAAGTAPNRMALWATFLTRIQARTVVEVGVYRGALAARLLADCPAIETYYMIDPWRHLADWNKPANRDDATFQAIHAEAMRRTAEHAHRRVVLRGRTTEVIDRIPDSSLDFAYIDADHTLRGITIDLLRTYPKVREGGWIAGDDFSPSIWQHGPRYEPTLVFPLAVHFAEATGTPIHGLPHHQFLIEKRPERGFSFIDLTQRYPDGGLLGQMAQRTAPPRDATPTPAVRAKRALRAALRPRRR